MPRRSAGGGERREGVLAGLMALIMLIAGTGPARADDGAPPPPPPPVAPGPSAPRAPAPPQPPQPVTVSPGATSAVAPASSGDGPEACCPPSGLPDRLLGGAYAPGGQQELPVPGPPTPPTAPVATGPSDAAAGGLPDRLLGLGTPDVRASPTGDPSPLDLWLYRRGVPLALRGVARPREGPRGLPVHGSMRAWYRVRRTSDGDLDQDLHEYLRLEVGDAWAPGWSGSFSGRLTQDLDGFGNSGGFDPFADVSDTYHDRVNGRVYHAYATHRWACGRVLEQARVGRQWIEAGDVFQVDGAELVSAPLRRLGNLQARVFGGVPAHLFEGSPDGDFMAGFSLEAQPWCGARAKLDYVHLQDTNADYGRRSNDLASIELRQRFGRNHSAWVRYQHLDARPSYIDFTYDGYFPGQDVQVRGLLRTLVNPRRALAYDIDPYFAVEQTLAPFYEGLFSVAKNWAPCFYAEVGAAGRWLYEAADVGRYNREFQRFFLNLGADDWPRRGWSVVLVGEAWTGDDTIGTVGFDVEYEPNDRWRFRLGSDYQLYRTDFYSDTERIDSRAVFLEARWRPTRRWRVDGRLRLENDDYFTYLTFDTSVQFDF